jgi:hypothetical protein
VEELLPALRRRRAIDPELMSGEQLAYGEGKLERHVGLSAPRAPLLGYSIRPAMPRTFARCTLRRWCVAKQANGMWGRGLHAALFLRVQVPSR